ncbi:hypothetical protein OH77DRAFT_187509, partial [Trametes cingulata]
METVLVQQILPVDVSAVLSLQCATDPHVGPNSEDYYVNFTSINLVGNSPAHYSQFSQASSESFPSYSSSFCNLRSVASVAARTLCGHHWWRVSPTRAWSSTGLVSYGWRDRGPVCR